METVLITGTNRGIGLEFVRQYAIYGWHIHACCRNPASADALESLTPREQEILDTDGRPEPPAVPAAGAASGRRLPGTGLPS